MSRRLKKENVTRVAKIDENGHYIDGNFTKIPNQFIDRRNFLSKNATNFYLYLCQGVNHKRFHEEDGTPDTIVWGSYETIMEDCQFTSRSQVRNAIFELKTLGFITVTLDFPPRVNKETGLIIERHYKEKPNSKKCNLYEIVLAGFPDWREFEEKRKIVFGKRFEKQLGIQASFKRSKKRNSPVQPNQTEEL